MRMRVPLVCLVTVRGHARMAARGLRPTAGHADADAAQPARPRLGRAPHRADPGGLGGALGHPLLGRGHAAAGRRPFDAPASSSSPWPSLSHRRDGRRRDPRRGAAAPGPPSRRGRRGDDDGRGAAVGTSIGARARLRFGRQRDGACRGLRAGSSPSRSRARKVICLNGDGSMLMSLGHPGDDRRLRRAPTSCLFVLQNDTLRGDGQPAGPRGGPGRLLRDGARGGLPAGPHLRGRRARTRPRCRRSSKALGADLHATRQGRAGQRKPPLGRGAGRRGDVPAPLPRRIGAAPPTCPRQLRGSAIVYAMAISEKVLRTLRATSEGSLPGPPSLAARLRRRGSSPTPLPSGGSGCTMTERAVANEGWGHVAEGTSVAYTANPPASGPHYPVWLRYEAYTTAQARPYWVHNLEHGAIRAAPPPGRAGLRRDRAQRDLRALPNDPSCGHPGALLTPDPALPTPFAAVAANFVLQGSCVNPQTIAQFTTAHRNQAPEDICSCGTAALASERDRHEQEGLSQAPLRDDGVAGRLAARGLGGRRQIDELGGQSRIRHRTLHAAGSLEQVRQFVKRRRPEGARHAPLLQHHRRQRARLALTRRWTRSWRSTPQARTVTVDAGMTLRPALPVPPREGLRAPQPGLAAAHLRSRGRAAPPRTARARRTATWRRGRAPWKSSPRRATW